MEKKLKGLLTIPYLTLQMKASAHFLTSIIFLAFFSSRHIIHICNIPNPLKQIEKQK